MARADLVLNLVKTGVKGDVSHFKRATQALIAEEKSKNHYVLAQQLEDILSETGESSRQLKSSLYKPSELKDALYETLPSKKIDDLVLPKLAKSQIAELLEEHNRRDLLRSYNLEPKHKVLLYGPPGNGKSSLAEAIAQSLALPFLTLHYEDVIQSFLGETAKKLDLVFEHAKNKRCVLFLDEFEAISKERGDEHESGEIKRLVSSLLTQIDRLPPHVIVVAATNHKEFIDKAFWRRFQMHVELVKPTQIQIKKWLSIYLRKSKQSFGRDVAELASQLKGFSFSEIESFALDVSRRTILAQPISEEGLTKVVDGKLSEWKTRLKS